MSKVLEVKMMSKYGAKMMSKYGAKIMSKVLW
jgi:hypothetical protein